MILQMKMLEDALCHETRDDSDSGVCVDDSSVFVKEEIEVSCVDDSSVFVKEEIEVVKKEIEISEEREKSPSCVESSEELRGLANTELPKYEQEMKSASEAKSFPEKTPSGSPHGLIDNEDLDSASKPLQEKEKEEIQPETSVIQRSQTASPVPIIGESMKVCYLWLFVTSFSRLTSFLFCK